MMKNKTIILSLVIAAFICLPAFNSSALVNETTIGSFQTKDTRASFPGGKEELKKWLKENMDYPEEARRYGTVVVDFVVKKNGKLDKFKVHKGVNEELDIIAIEILRGMPKWEPAMKDGKEIDSNVQMPVKFVPISEKGDLE